MLNPEIISSLAAGTADRLGPDHIVLVYRKMVHEQIGKETELATLRRYQKAISQRIEEINAESDAKLVNQLVNGYPVY